MMQCLGHIETNQDRTNIYRNIRTANILDVKLNCYRIEMICVLRASLVFHSSNVYAMRSPINQLSSINNEFYFFAKVVRITDLADHGSLPQSDKAFETYSCPTTVFFVFIFCQPCSYTFTSFRIKFHSLIQFISAVGSDVSNKFDMAQIYLSTRHSKNTFCVDFFLFLHVALISHHKRMSLFISNKSFIHFLEIWIMKKIYGMLNENNFE